MAPASCPQACLSDVGDSGAVWPAAWEGKNFKVLALVVMRLDSLELDTRGCGICNHGLAPADALPRDRKDCAQEVGF